MQLFVSLFFNHMVILSRNYGALKYRALSPRILTFTCVVIILLMRILKNFICNLKNESVIFVVVFLFKNNVYKNLIYAYQYSKIVIQVYQKYQQINAFKKEKEMSLISFVCLISIFEFQMFFDLHWCASICL